MNQPKNHLKDRCLYIARDIVHTWKGITYGYKQFLCFFIAVFVCQAFCQILILSNATNNRHTEERVEAEYDYHLTISGLTQAQTVLLSNELSEENSLKTNYVWKAEEEYDGYTMYVTLAEPSVPNGAQKRLYKSFVSKVLPDSGIPIADEEGEVVNWTLTLSPLYTCYNDYILQNDILSLVIVIPLAIVSVLLLMFLYRIRLNDRKFMFGIYMTFGADFKVLFKGAVKELLLLSAVTLIPSAAFSVLTTCLIYLPNGIPLAFPLWQIFLFLLFNFAVVYLSVYLPMKSLSRKTPLSLITSEDNSNLVSSPRRSFRIFGKRFPRDYELFGFWRYRFYYLKLVLTATLFAACFFCGICICNLYTDVTTGEIEQYVITLPSDLYDSEEALSDCADFISSIDKIPGVSYSEWNLSSAATACRSFMLLQTDNAYNAASYVVQTTEISNTEQYTASQYEQYVDNGYTAATNAYAYTLYDEKMIDRLCESYTVDGDPYALLSGTNQIIVSESIFDRSVFCFSPGDTVILCERVSGSVSEDLIYIDSMAVLAEQLRVYGIRFHVFTVCAVIRDMQSENTFVAGLNASAYAYFTDGLAVPDNVSVYLERGLSVDELQSIYEKILWVMRPYTDTGYTVTKTENYLSYTLTEQKYSGVRAIIWSCLILVLSPLIWMFSQILFYRKREKEFWIIRAFGAFGTDIRGIHLWSGLLLGAAAIVAVLLEGFLCNGLMYVICNRILAVFGLLGDVRYSFSVSVVALLMAVIASALFAFLSSYLPYRIFLKKERQAEKAAATPTNRDESDG